MSCHLSNQRQSRKFSVLLSIRQVRTALDHLKSTGEVTVKNYPKFRIITVVSYDSFQGSDRQNDRKTTGNRQAKRQAGDRQATADIRTYKNNKEDKKIREASPPEDDEDEGEPWPDDFWEI